MKKLPAKLKSERKRTTTYYSLHWMIRGTEHGLSGSMTSMCSHAISVLGLGADVVVITKCRMEKYTP